MEHLWFVDPLARTLEALELREDETATGERNGLAPVIWQWVLIGSAADDDPVGLRPLDAITFGLADLWR